VSSLKDNAWIIDSDCSHHMTRDKSNFKTLESIDDGSVMFGSNQIKSKIIGLSTVGNKNITISNVYLIDGLNYNLLSVSRLCDVGYYVKFDVNSCYLMCHADNSLVYTGEKKKNIYYLQFDHFKHGELCLNAITSDSWLWHRKLAHISIDSIKKLIKLELVCGLPTNKIQIDSLCGACAQGKQSKSSFKSKNMVSTNKPLQLIHIDLFGPIDIPSLVRKRYVYMIVDDYSRFIWVIFLETKEETFQNFIIFYTRVENEKGLKINKIRSDHGREFENIKFNTFCFKMEYSHKFSAPCTTQQNGIVKRKNMTLQELTRTILHEYLLPKHLWVEAVNIIYYVINRVSIKY
jgi:GAG-pre-integrase domain/Integrase core domain